MLTDEEIKDAQHNYIDFIVYSTLLQEKLDDLKNTSLYKQGIKNKVNSLMSELEPMLAKELTMCFNISEDAIINELKDKSDIIMEIMRLDEQEYYAIKVVLAKFKTTKDDKDIESGISG